MENQRRKKLFKITNKQHFDHSVEMTEYNLSYWIERIEKMTNYHMVFMNMHKKSGIR